MADRKELVMTNYLTLDYDMGQSPDELGTFLNGYGASGWQISQVAIINRRQRRAIFTMSGTAEYLVVDQDVGLAADEITSILNSYGVDGWVLTNVDLSRSDRQRAIFMRNGSGGGTGGGIPEAPTDGTIYGRRGSDTSWQPSPPGPPGQGVPAGGATAQVLTKNSTADYDTSWLDSASGGGGVSDAPSDGTMYGRENAAWARAVAVAGDTMTGDLGIVKANPIMVLNKTASGQAGRIVGNLNGTPRWHVIFGDGAIESGGNVGSNFVIQCYDDVGNPLGNAISITRSTGLATVNGDPTAALGIATKQYVDAQTGAGLPDAPSDGAHYARINAAWGNIDVVYMRWVPYTGPPQSFIAQDMTRDGDWTMVANKNTSDRPAPQSTGADEDLLPATWTPTAQNARASYTVLNEWTLSQAGWINQYGGDIHAQNVGATHTITLQVNGVVKDTYTFVPNAAGMHLHDITPMVVVVGAIIRVTVQVTQLANNQMYWYQQIGLFATPPTYTSLAQGSKDGGAMTATGYCCHLMFTPGTASPDWDVVAYGGTAGAGGGGATTIPEAPQDGTPYGRLNAAWAQVLPIAAVPVGGAAGQVLAKNSATDYDTQWTTRAFQ